MPRTNSWLCTYAIAQLGRPYWYATSGQISSVSLYTNTVKPAIIRDLGSACLYNNYASQLNVKVHDCSGLVVGALTCDTLNGNPSGTSPIAHGATSQFDYDCKTKSNSMTNFPYIPGTLVFVKNGSNKKHVGIYVGNYIDKDGKEHSNAVVEAMGHQWGVTTTSLSNSKWGAWGQLSCCKVDTSKGMKFDARANTISGDPKSIIQTQNMMPFAATIAPDANPKINYEKIKAARISIMMFFAGELFDAGHSKKSSYMNPHLPNLISDSSSAGMPYALYVNIRAKNEIEADEECRALYYVVSQFSPTLGLWLSLQNNSSININDNILELYYRYIDKWGLRARCGLYLNSSQLSKISWNKFKDRFYLWLIDPMDISKVDDELLQPEMFEVPD